MAENKTVESAASPWHFSLSDPPPPHTHHLQDPLARAPRRGVCSLAGSLAAAADRSLRHARGLAGLGQWSGPGPGVGGSREAGAVRAGLGCVWGGEVVVEGGVPCVRQPSPRLRHHHFAWRRRGSHVRRGRGSEGRRGVGAAPVTAAPRGEQGGRRGGLLLGRPGARRSAAKALLFLVAGTSVSGRHRKGHVCAFCWKWLKLGTVVGKGDFLREECCVQSCNIATCQGSFVYLCKYYFPILWLSRPYRVSSIPRPVDIMEKLAPERVV